NETGLTIARYPDLSDSSCTRTLMSYSLDSYYYPVGARGVAPFASTALRRARVAESTLQIPILGSCVTVSTTSQISLGLRRGLGADVASSHLLWNVNCRVLWLTRNDGANVFGVQAGVALSPALRRAH